MINKMRTRIHKSLYKHDYKVNNKYIIIKPYKSKKRATLMFGILYKKDVFESIHIFSKEFYKIKRSQ